MPSRSKLISADIDKSWEAVSNWYRKEINVAENAPVQNKVIKKRVKTTRGRTIPVTQSINIDEVNKKISSITTSLRSIVTTTITFETHDETCFKLTYTEVGKGNKYWFNSFNFFLWSLPILRRKTHKKINYLLAGMEVISVNATNDKDLSVQYDYEKKQHKSKKSEGKNI